MSILSNHDEIFFVSSFIGLKYTARIFKINYNKISS